MVYRARLDEMARGIFYFIFLIAALSLALHLFRPGTRGQYRLDHNDDEM